MSSTLPDSMLADSARDYVQRGYGESVRTASMADPHGCSAARWREFAEMGWLGLAVAESDGGLGGSVHDICSVAEAMGRALVVEPFVACAVLGAGILSAAVDPGLRRAWLPGIVAGRLRLACAPWEDTTALDHRRITTQAQADSGGHRLRGHKSLVPGGHGADAWLLAAHVGDGGELGLFLVPAGAAGLRVVPRTLIDGQHAVQLDLDGVIAQATLLCAGPDVVLAVLETALARATVAHCAETVGAMQRAFDITLDYLKTRKQFGRTIASNQVVQHRLVDLFVEIEEARAATYAAAAMLDQNPAAETALSRRQVSGAKACVAQAARLVWSESVQLHGAIGMTDEYVLGSYVKRLAVATGLYGSLEHHLEQLACIALDSAAPEPA